MDVQQSYTLEEVAQHNKRDDLWMVIDGKVYNCTEFVDEHPGGGDYIIDNAGRDATLEFIDAGHSEKAIALLKDFYIGECSNAKHIGKLNAPATAATSNATTTEKTESESVSSSQTTDNSTNNISTRKSSSSTSEPTNSYLIPLIIIGAVVVVSAVIANNNINSIDIYSGSFHRGLWTVEDLKQTGWDFNSMNADEKQKFNLLVLQRILDQMAQPSQLRKPVSKIPYYGPYTSFVNDPYKTDPYTGAYQINPVLGGDNFISGLFGTSGGPLGGRFGASGFNGGGLIAGGYPGQFVLSAIFPNQYMANGPIAGLLTGDIRNPIYDATRHPPPYISTAYGPLAPYLQKRQGGDGWQN
ncbi:hypothetical protein PPL_02343 [Heterostelium album PN500]|uniref:Cytochrome b5 heme-binding domain-containing protein n=1 Tax=Heterostelium pallidum (strain ATCC 26659 / Pp 5 / PN500) TaxID=670386 RepID=D3B216_HETP5|nr:hypothetical protein PPL_02343 [Heterostelium album PN500]EFA85340.1 hypothetical protein PPL_02343 [Heterostelium album PN500]|eukprot:XP_020437449.1 hypothetical protein PPL_02343 [Heterostelium album PN500]